MEFYALKDGFVRFLLLFRQLLIPPVALVFSVVVYPAFGAVPLVFLAILMAVFLSILCRNHWHWHGLHGAVMALAWVAMSLEVSPLWYLLAAVLLGLVYSGLMFTNVPLYFTGRRQVQAAQARLLPSDRRIADLGAGIGSFVLPIARARPDIQIDAFEVAPVPYFLGRWRCRHLLNVRWHLKPYEKASLACYDVVYCFLSPEPMPEVWHKVLAEMRSGTRLFSNSFAVPNVVPSHVDLADSAHPLFGYEVPVLKSAAGA